MYLYPGYTYYRGTEQCRLRDPFLLLLQPDKPTISDTCSPDNTYAVVRQVALRQCGHWMMGSANLCGRWVTVSGAYGSDGLPMALKTLPKDAVLLPRELYDLWARGGGHNSAGSEADALRKWAIKTFMKGRRHA